MSLTQRRRLTAQLLAGSPARDPLAVAERLLAIQAQDARGARLAVRARTVGLTAADVDRALSEDRSLVVTWLNRGTLHLVRSEDYFWLHAVTTPPLLRANDRRLSQLGVRPHAADRGLRVIERALGRDGPLTRDELAERLHSTDVPTQGQAIVHVLMRASLHGIVVRGPVTGHHHAYALVRDWLGERQPVERGTALAELARRYLSGHGPAGERDLARWAGLPLRDCRAGLGAVASELEQTADGLVHLARRPAPAELPPPRLLGPFEPLLLGWDSREPVVGTHEKGLVAGGVFRPFVLVRGRAAGTWRLSRGDVAIEPFGRLRRADAAALADDAQDVVRFLDRS